MALGLTADDIFAVDNFMDELKEKNTISGATRGITQEAEKDELRMRVGSLLGITERDELWMRVGSLLGITERDELWMRVGAL